MKNLFFSSSFLLSTLISTLAYSSALTPNDVWSLSEGNFSSSPGYVSSYQPLKQGGPIQVKTVPHNPLPGILNLRSEESSLLDRFLWASESVLDFKNESSLKIFREHFTRELYSESAMVWEGNCHNWAAASTNKTINTWLSTSKGLICGNVAFDDADLRELFTTFYVGQGKSFYGMRRMKIGLDDETDEMYQYVLDSVGYTYLDPHAVHSVLVDNLSKQKGVVVNVDPNFKVWNQPVFRYTFEREDITHSYNWPNLHFLRFAEFDYTQYTHSLSNYELIRQLLANKKNYVGMSQILEGENEKANYYLKLIDEMDSLLIELFLKGFFPNNKSTSLVQHIKNTKIELSMPLSLAINEFMLEQNQAPMLFDQIRSLNGLRQTWLNLSILEGIRPKWGVHVYHYHGRIHYLEEMEYRSNDFGIDKFGRPIRIGTNESPEEEEKLRQQIIARLPYEHQLTIPSDTKKLDFYVVHIKKPNQADLILSRWTDPLSKKNPRSIGGIWIPKHYNWDNLKFKYFQNKDKWPEVYEAYLKLKELQRQNPGKIEIEKQVMKADSQLEKMALGQMSLLFDRCSSQKKVVQKLKYWKTNFDQIRAKTVPVSQAKSFLKIWKVEFEQFKTLPFTEEFLNVMNETYRLYFP